MLPSELAVHLLQAAATLHQFAANQHLFAVLLLQHLFAVHQHLAVVVKLTFAVILVPELAC